MERLSENIVKGESRTEVFKVGKKKYTRIASPRGVEWKRYKTNHQVKQMEFNALENLYNKKFPPHFINAAYTHGKAVVTPSSKNKGKFIVSCDKSGAPIIEDDTQRRAIERGLLDVSQNGRKELAGVKYVKEQTGWGLKESKLFVDAFFERKKAFERW